MGNRIYQRTRAILWLVCFALLFYLYAFFVEPFWIEVTHNRLTSKAITRPLKLMLLTDLHIKRFGRREKFVLKTVERERPDIIAVTGDYVSNPLNIDAIIELLGRLNAPLGVYVVPGNWEHRYSIPELDRKLSELPNLKLLSNSAASVSFEFAIVGLDDRMTGRPDPETAFKAIPDKVFRLVLFHSPAQFDHLNQNFDLALAGHSHGGQVRIPFLPPLWLPGETWPYVAGWYGDVGRKMYVSRGVGNTLLDARFACRPEVAVIHLEPGS